jgi:hypothetical protein
VDDVSVLIARYEFWEKLAYLAAGIVLIGVLCEEIPDHTTGINFESWKKSVKRVGAILLILGLAGDVATLVETSAINGDLIRRAEPRTLSPQQQSKLAAELRAFAGQQFSLAITPDPEPVALMKQIYSVVNAAGWSVIPAQMQGDVSLGKAVEVVATGVKIQFVPNASSETVSRARLFASLLKSDGIPADAEPNPGLANISALNILVGAKG